MRDLTELMQANVVAREQSIAGIQPSPGTLDGAVRRVRRSRAVRHTLRAGGAVAVAGVLAGASWFGLRGHEAPVPALTPAPTVTPTTTPTPMPSETAVPVVLDEIPGLPPTQAMPFGLLERTTQGWVLTIYRSTPSSPSPDDDIYETDPVVHTVVLVSPTGDRYRVTDLPLDTRVHLLSWDAGGTTALVSTVSSDGETGRAVLDLLTGEITPGEPFDQAGYGSYVGRAADGAELWESFDSAAQSASLFRIVDGGAPERIATMGSGEDYGPSVFDATGRWLAVGADGGYAGGKSFVVLDVITGERAEYAYGVDGKRCSLIGWAGRDSLLAICDVMSDEGALTDATLYRLDVSGGSLDATAVLELADGEPVPGSWGGMAVSGDRVLLPMVDSGPGDPCDSGGVSMWDGHSLTTLKELRPGPDDDTWRVAVGDVAYSGNTEACGMSLAAEVTAHDLATGSSLVLAPEPAPAGEDHWAQTITSWLVAGSRLPGVGW